MIKIKFHVYKIEAVNGISACVIWRYLRDRLPKPNGSKEK